MMLPRTEWKSLTVAATLISFTIVVAFLYFAKSVIIPIAMAATIAFVLNPVVRWMESWGLGRMIAVLATIGIATLLVGGLIWLVGVQAGDLVSDLPKYQQNIQNKLAALRSSGQNGTWSKMRTLLQLVDGDDTDEARGQRALSRPRPAVARLVTNDSWFTKALGPLQAMSPALEAAATGLLSLVLTIFMLIRREDLRNRLVSFANTSSLTTTTQALNDAGSRISRYLIRQFTINSSFGLVIGIGLFFIGIPYAPVWGLCAAILRYVPYVGALISAVPPLVMSFVVFPGWSALILVFMLFIFLELVTGNVLEPWVYGHGTGVSEVAILVCATFWLLIWGPVGLILATPLTVCLVVTGKYVPALAFFDRLLGDRPTLEPAVAYFQRLLAHDSIEAAAVVLEFSSMNATEEVYDNLFIPALTLARQDRTSGLMSAEDERFIVSETTNNVAAVVKTLASRSKVNGSKPALLAFFRRLLRREIPSPIGDTPANSGQPTTTLEILGFPAHQKIEELPLQMLDRLVASSGIHIETFSTHTIPSDLIEEVRARNPRLVLISALPPSGIPQSCFLCESLRSEFPALPIIVGYWGCETNLDEVISNLRSAGAHYVTTTLGGARSHVSSMLADSTNDGRA